jgi:hypothetical protein
MAIGGEETQRGGIRAPEALLAHVKALAGKIGPRGTGTTGEAQAARYVRERLQELGLPVEERRFRAVADMNWFPISAALFSLAGTALYPWSRWSAAVIATLAAPLLWWAIAYADSPLRFLLPKVLGRNVVACIAPEGRVVRRAVVLSHLDSNRCRLAWRAGRAKAIKRGSIATLSVYGLNGLLYLVGAASGLGWPYFASLPGAAYALATLIVLLVEMGQPYSPGANDNAASVAVNLELAALLAREPLNNTEVWLAFTGAEEVDHRGVKVLLKEHPELRGAYFIDLEGVGAGELCHLTEEGIIKRYRLDLELVRLAERVAGRRPDLQVRPAAMPMVDEVQTLRRLHCKAICLAGRDLVTGSLPHWHTCDDVVENISAEVLLRAAEFARELLQELDGRTGR